MDEVEGEFLGNPIPKDVRRGRKPVAGNRSERTKTTTKAKRKRTSRIGQKVTSVHQQKTIQEFVDLLGRLKKEQTFLEIVKSYFLDHISILKSEYDSLQKGEYDGERGHVSIESLIRSLPDYHPPPAGSTPQVVNDGNVEEEEADIEMIDMADVMNDTQAIRDAMEKLKRRGVSQ